MRRLFSSCEADEAYRLLEPEFCDLALFLAGREDGPVMVADLAAIVGRDAVADDVLGAAITLITRIYRRALDEPHLADVVVAVETAAGLPDLTRAAFRAATDRKIAVLELAIGRYQPTALAERIGRADTAWAAWIDSIHTARQRAAGGPTR